jgi:hypothetical protein
MKGMTGQRFARTLERSKDQSIHSHKRFFENIKYVTPSLQQSQQKQWISRRSRKENL